MNQSRKPKPGDLIEIFRDDFQHWAVYVGDGDIVHVTSLPGAEALCAVSNTLMSVSTEKAMVRREKLREVVGVNRCRINNSLDKEYEPRPAHIIVKEALSLVGKMMEYNFIMKNCEHFVNKLRYGRDVSWQPDETPKPGDLIEIFRDDFQHWAVYVGDGDIVHVTSPPETEVPCGDSRGLLSVPGAVSNTLMSVSTEKAMVRREKLREVVGKNRWRINNSLDKEYEPRPAHIIVEEALRQEDKMMEYNFIMKNCEHFVNKLRYGRDVSWQVGEKAKLIFAGAAMGAIAATGGTIAAASAVALAFLLRK